MGPRPNMVAPPRAAVDSIVAARIRLDLGTSVFDQLVVTELLRAGPSLLRDRREHLRQQRDALAAALARYLPEWRFRLPSGGLALWVHIPGGSATRLSADLEKAGVYVAPGPMFTVEGGADSWIRIPFTRPALELEEGIRRIADGAAGAAGRATRTGERGRVLIA